MPSEILQKEIGRAEPKLVDGEIYQPAERFVNYLTNVSPRMKRLLRDSYLEYLDRKFDELKNIELDFSNRLIMWKLTEKWCGGKR